MIRISKITREIGLDIIVNGLNQLTYCKLSLRTEPCTALNQHGSGHRIVFKAK